MIALREKVKTSLPTEKDASDTLSSKISSALDWRKTSNLITNPAPVSWTKKMKYNKQEYPLWRQN